MSSKKLTSKQILIGFAVLSCIALFFCITVFGIFYPIVKIIGPSWPKINNPSKLIEECKPLLRNDPDFIKEVNWPESIKNLSPMNVYGEKEYVDIRISGGGVGQGWGYLVYPNFGANTLVPIDYIILGSVYTGIFRYEDKQS
jgi:hypothetical protein